MLDRQKDLMPYTPESHTMMGWAGLHSDLPPTFCTWLETTLGTPSCSILAWDASPTPAP